MYHGTVLGKCQMNMKGILWLAVAELKKCLTNEIACFKVVTWQPIEHVGVLCYINQKINKKNMHPYNLLQGALNI